MTIGEVLKQQRSELGLSQLDLAEMAEVGLSTIKDIERSKGNPSLHTLEKIMEVLGLEIQYGIRQTV